MSVKKAVILVSGGLDSTTCLALAKDQGYQCYALSFSYGQRHSSELLAAKRVAEHFEVEEYRVANIDLAAFGGSSLTDTSMAIPEGESEGEVPNTYVPARNTIFLSYALAWAEVLQAEAIFIGVNAVDYSGYPDCRPEYIAAFEKMANLATVFAIQGQSLRIETPLMHLSKAEIIRLGVSLNVDYALTVSCYQADAEGLACGRCDSCRLRKQGFVEAGIDDMTRYRL